MVAKIRDVMLSCFVVFRSPCSKSVRSVVGFQLSGSFDSSSHSSMEMLTSVVMGMLTSVEIGLMTSVGLMTSAGIGLITSAGIGLMTSAEIGMMTSEGIGLIASEERAGRTKRGGRLVTLTMSVKVPCS